MAPYPKELRVRVVAAVEEGRFAIPEIARIFQVGVTFIKKMLNLHRAGDPLDPRHGGGSAWGDENPVRLTMEGDPVFVPFQKAVFGALVDQKGQDRGTKTATSTPEKLS